MRWRLTVVAFGLGIMTTVMTLNAQEATNTDKDKQTRVKQELIDQQQRLERRFREFVESLYSLKQKLEKSGDPKNIARAKLLGRALELSREKTVREQFTTLVKTLQSDSFKSIDSLQGTIDRSQNLAASLKGILDILREDERDTLNREKQEQLRKWIARLNEIIRNQKNVQAQTQYGKTKKGELAKLQGDVSKQTSDLQKDIAGKKLEGDVKGSGKGKGKSGEAKDAGQTKSGKRGEGKSAGQSGQKGSKQGQAKGSKGGQSKSNKTGNQGSKSGMKGGAKGSKSSGSKAGGSKSGGSKSGGSKAGGAKGSKSGSPKSGEGKKGDAKDDGKKKGTEDESKVRTKAKGEGKKTGGGTKKSGENKAGAKGGSKQSGSKSGGAKGSKSSGSKSGGSKSGSKSQSKQGQAKGGSKSSGKGSSKSSGSKSGKSGGGGAKGGNPQQQQPDDGITGKKKIKEAGYDQYRAEQKIKEGKNDDAAGKQGDAIKKLEDAKKKLEELLRQLREEELEQLLAALELRCRKMLVLQKQVLAGTENAAAEQNKRLRQTQAIRLADEEKVIVLEADKAIELLKAEGSAVAFPEVFKQVREDMVTVQNRLLKAKVSDVTQAIEKDIISTLEEMIEALKKAQKQQKSKKGKSGKSGKSPNGQQKLLDQIAELKMIRSMQIRVNKRTQLYGRRYNGEQANDEEIGEAIRNLAERQERIFDVTNRIAKGDNK